ncbi:deoxyribodipyrimidine photo-lyase [Devosia sp.]|uniref:cryptochrome/photolyase family protein n=1 Tax=Devosia sp. TaxID=1871048 RepID=UPI002AFE2E11|nr:deoxyribodipyrimidine photo-lyase [Devosia sp.]
MSLLGPPAASSHEFLNLAHDHVNGAWLGQRRKIVCCALAAKCFFIKFCFAPIQIDLISVFLIARLIGGSKASRRRDDGLHSGAPTTRTEDALTQKSVLVWFRSDLRTSDNPALEAALATGKPVLAIYIHETDAALRRPGGASSWWLEKSLDGLALSLGDIGVPLNLREGQAGELIAQMVQEDGVDAVYWNRRYDPAGRAIDARIKSALRDGDVEAQSFNAALLVEPWDLLTGQNKPYAVFTPFWNALRKKPIARPGPAPAARPARLNRQKSDRSVAFPKWTTKLEPLWEVGERAAQDRLILFLDTVGGYDASRDFPARAATSQLSPHLRFGEIGPRQVWHGAMAHAHRHPGCQGAVMKFLSELAWRDFNYHQLFHRDDISRHPMQPHFAAMAWRRDPGAFEAWCRGRTGYPIIDAGMRELWQTGYMHNRVRMLAASFLAKNLLLDWRQGEEWFWDCLVDADPASNPGNWQWVSGSGLDAAPWFRIFNPVLQGERFDPAGAYVHRWVPEIAGLPDEFLHRPFEAPSGVLEASGVVLGHSYPHPIVNLPASRRRALDALPRRPAVVKE